MKNWIAYTIGEIGRVVTGKTPSSSTPEHFGDAMPFVTPTDFKNYVKSISHADRSISQTGVRANTTRIIPEDSVLVTCIGSEMGKVAVNKVPCLTNQQINSIILDKTLADKDFVYYALTSKYELLRSLARGGSTMPIINKTQFERIEVSFPPLEEQKAIARILSSLDDKIELNRRMNATLEAMARALFKAWFVDFEPVHASLENRPSTSASPEIAKLFPSEFENGLPKGWRVGTLSEIATNYRQNIDPNEIDSETPYVGLEHIPRGSLALTEWGTASKAESTKSEFKTNDILFGKLRPYFHKVVIAPVIGICSTDILVVRPKEKYHFGEAAILLSSDALIQYATQLSNGAKMPRTSWSDLAKFKTVIPSHEVSEVYTKFVSSLAGRILANIKESQTLEETRDSLLPPLISGRISIRDILPVRSQAEHMV